MPMQGKVILSDGKTEVASRQGSDDKQKDGETKYGLGIVERMLKIFQSHLAVKSLKSHRMLNFFVNAALLVTHRA